MLIFFFSLSFFTLASASVTDLIQTLVKENKSSTVEAVVRGLPEDLRKNFTLVHKGRALIQSSPEFPGVILFGKDGKTLLAFNGSPTHRGYRALDILEYDDAKKEYLPVRFFFSPTEKDLRAAPGAQRISGTEVYFEPKPMVCMGCHGEKNHPIFESGYPTWEGFYGSHRDHLFGEDLQKEVLNFKKFQLFGKKTPRYEALIFPSEFGSTMSPYLDENTEHKLTPGAAHAYRPNLVLGALLVRTNAHTIFKTLKASPSYEKWKLLLAYSLQRCSLTALDPKKLLLIQTSLDEEGLKLRKDFRELKLISTSFLDSEGEAQGSLAARLIAILGVTPDLWNLSVRGMGTSKEYGYWSGYGDTLDLIKTQILKEIFGDELHKNFIEALPPLSQDEEAIQLREKLRSLGVVYEPKDQVGGCQTLAGLRNL
jgi:hypothetical protein